MNLRNRIKQEEAAAGSFRHPIGEFDATVEEVKERTHDGQVIYELHVRSDIGKIAKHSVWKNTFDDSIGRFMQMGATREQAEDKYAEALGRLCRLYSDLGLESPDGEDHIAIETACYARLGEMVGRPCKLVVVKDKKKEGEVRVFINAAPGNRAVQGHQTHEPATAFAGTGNFPEVPF